MRQQLLGMTLPVIFVSFVVFPNAVLAQTDEIVELVNQHDARAAELFDQGDFEGALVEQEAAQELLPATPRLFNMAACQERLDNLAEAIELYQRFLESSDAPEERRELVRQRISDLREQIEDDSQTDVARPVQRPSEAPTQTSDPPPISHQTDTPIEAAAAPTDEVPDAGPARLPPVAFYTMLGVTSASTVAVVVLGALTLARHQEFLDLYRSEGNSRELQVTGRNLSLVTNLLIGFAALSAATTLVLGLVTEFGRERRRTGERRVEVSAAVSGRGGVVGLRGRF